MDTQNGKLNTIQEYLYQERNSNLMNDSNTNNINNVSQSDKNQTKKQKDLSNEILYFSINQDSK
jgi:hypothetical protein